MSENFVYSLDGERFYDLESTMDLLESEYEPGRHKVFRGVPRKVKHSDFIVVHKIIVSLQERCWDEHGEYTEHYLNGLTAEDEKELEEIISDFITLKAGEIKFYSVDNVEEVELTTE